MQNTTHAQNSVGADGSTVFRVLLIAMAVIIFAFTALAVQDGGFDFVTPFVAPILAGRWQGQFNVDFSLYLVLSGAWMAWRSGFSRGGIALGLFAPWFGMAFFAPYLLYLTVQKPRSLEHVLLGVRARG